MIRLTDIQKIYNSGKPNAVTALDHVSLEIAEGEMAAVIGRSGAGKSTLLHILACIDSFEGGDYCIGGMSVRSLPERKLARIRNEKIGLVMQDHALIEDFTALENVMLPLDFAVRKKPNRRQLAAEALRSVGMADLAKKPAGRLSGGQKQRVAIARAIVAAPSVLLADEPTGALDSKTAQEIMDVFKGLHAQGRTIVIVTHDMHVAQQCGRILEIADGKIVRDSKVSQSAQ